MLSRLPMAPLRMASVESPAMTGPVTVNERGRHGQLAQLFGQGHAGNQGFDPAHEFRPRHAVK